MRRMTENERDRGATAVMFALSLLVLMGFVGAGVDVASAYAKTQEVQNAADAGALGVAQQCATTGCAGDAALAQELATGNIRLETASVTTAVNYPAANQVRVVAEGNHQNYLLGLFGQPSFRVREEATAVWGPPNSGPTVMPLTFSLCNFESQGGASGASATIMFTKTSPAACTLPTSGNTMPSGFAYVGDSTSCGEEIAADGWYGSQSGNTPQGCSADVIKSYVGKTVLLPIFDACRATNINNAPGCTLYAAAGGSPDENGVQRDYHIYAFAAFKLEGFNFGGQYKAPTSGAPCGGSDRCVRGAFVEYVSLEDAWNYGGAPDLGSSIVTLVD